MEIRIVDQLCRTVVIPNKPERIISLVPSITELLFDLGLDNEIVGITDYCILPKDKVADKTRIGGVKQIDLSAIEELSPDFVLASKEENDRDEIMELQKHYPVWVSDVHTLNDVFSMIESIGVMVNRMGIAQRLVGEMKSGFDMLPAYLPMQAAYLVWNNPCIVAATGTLIDEIMQKCGLTNVYKHLEGYPQIDRGSLGSADIILLTSEPYSFDIGEIESFKQDFPQQEVYCVDGLMFSWYGSHLRLTPAYLKHLREAIFPAR